MILRKEPDGRRDQRDRCIDIVLPPRLLRVDGGHRPKAVRRLSGQALKLAVAGRGVSVQNRRQVADPRRLDVYAVHLGKEPLRGRSRSQVPERIGAEKRVDVSERHEPPRSRTVRARCHP